MKTNKNYNPFKSATSVNNTFLSPDLMYYDHHILTELASHLFPLSIPFRDEFLICQAKSFTKRTDLNTISLRRLGKLTERKKKTQPVKHKTENLAGDQSEPTRQRLFIWVLFCLRG